MISKVNIPHIWLDRQTVNIRYSIYLQKNLALGSVSVSLDRSGPIFVALVFRAILIFVAVVFVFALIFALVFAFDFQQLHLKQTDRIAVQ